MAGRDHRETGRDRFRATMRGATAALATVSFLGTLCALEAATRLVLPPGDRTRLPHVGLPREAQNQLAWIAERHEAETEQLGLHRHDPLLGWRPLPGVRTRLVKPGSYDVEVTTNAAGLRTAHEVSRTKPPDGERIALFGCSQTFGTGVADDETYGARLAQALPDVEVLNFGVGGYGTDQMLLSLERDGLDYRPDVAVLAFAFYHVRRNVQGFRFFAKPRFALESDGALRLVGTPVPSPDDVLAGDAPAIWPAADRSVLLRWFWQRVLARREDALLAPDGRAWTLTRTLIARFAERVAEQAGTMLLLNLDDVPDRPLAPALAELADELGIHFLDAVPALRDASRAGRLRLPHDPHWNAEGHLVIAGQLAEHLCAAELVRGCPPPTPVDGKDLDVEA